MASVLRRSTSLASLAVAGLCIAILARWLWGYPVCKAEDEHIWAYILSLRDKGISPPISGPLFVWTTECLLWLASLPHALGLALVGTLAVPLLILAMAWAYRSVSSASLVRIGLALACTTYFWAPFMLSRPQQWGQVCFLAGNVMAWLFLKGRVSWAAVAAIFVVTALTHVLSFGLLAASVMLMGMVLVLLQQAGSALLRKLLLALAIGAIPILIPGGPYAPLIQEVLDRHILLSAEAAFILLLGVTAGIAFSLRMGGALADKAQGMASTGLRWLDHHANLALLGICCGILLVLGWQALILSSEAWVPYGDSALLVVFSQLGNVFFLALTLWGVVAARREHVEGHHDEWSSTFGLFLLCSAALAVAAFAGSFLLRDTNWMLRVMNYGVLVAAPFAALGLSRFQERFPAQWLPATLILVSLSYLSTIRVPFLFHC